MSIIYRHKIHHLVKLAKGKTKPAQVYRASLKRRQLCESLEHFYQPHLFSIHIHSYKNLNLVREKSSFVIDISIFTIYEAYLREP